MAPGGGGRGEEGDGGRAAAALGAGGAPPFPASSSGEDLAPCRALQGEFPCPSYGVLKPEVGYQPERFPVLSLLRLCCYDAGSAHAGLGGARAQPESIRGNVRVQHTELTSKRWGGFAVCNPKTLGDIKYSVVLCSRWHSE